MASVADLADVSAADLAGYSEQLPDQPGAVLAVHPRLVPSRQLAPLLRHHGKRGFVAA